MSGRIAILTGGVGGAKLVDGLVRLLDPRQVSAIINVGDDFNHFGLHVSPDVDTILYTLSGQAHPEQGWGRKDESWQFMAAIGSLGGETWFRLGDGDLALHILRSVALRGGTPLSAIVADFARRWGIEAELIPASDDRLATMVETDEGTLPFQRYFVERRCEPIVRAIRVDGAQTARPGPGVTDILLDPDTRAIIIAPSNPFLSIDPILAVPGIRSALAAAPTPVVAVSPLVGGQSVKGPTGKIMAELGLPLSAASVAKHYRDFLDGILVDSRDPPLDLDLPSARADTLMLDASGRVRVAQAALGLADRLR